MKYAELHALSSFTFLRGASHPEELITRARELGYAALALTDECSVAGVVRAHVAAKDQGFKLIVGSEFRLQDGLRLALYATNRKTYGDLAQLITRGRRAAKKGKYCLTRSDVSELAASCLALWLPEREIDSVAAQWLSEVFRDNAWIAVELLRDGNDREHLNALVEIGRQTGVPLVAANNVHMHVRQRRPLQDALTAIRLRCTVETAGHALHANGERHLRRRETLARLYPGELLAETLVLAERCRFSLDELRYEYPEELAPKGETAAQYLRRLTEAGISKRWPAGETAKVRRLIEHELQLIAELGYEPYFLTVYDIVEFARSRNILCQGRGSAANSAVCFALGITEVDPSRMEMLFERFISKERNEPPDIDVDFEHERREEVIQYLYNKYGRHRAALTGTVITYRPRSAIRDVGKALGLSLEQVDRLSKNMQWWDSGRSRGAQGVDPERLREIGFDPANPVMVRLIALIQQILGFPRHLSQHVGGFVIARDDLSRLVPIENASMSDRTTGYRGRSRAEPVSERSPGIGSRDSDRSSSHRLRTSGRNTGVTASRGSEHKSPGSRETMQPPRPVAATACGHEHRDVLQPREPMRTVIQWDKDDLDALGLLKVDCLALGMLTAIHRACDLLTRFRGRPYSLAGIPPEDPTVYDMIQHGDTVGVFQIESRAQMAMLPRLKPANFYDLVIEVAIVRPGPIQGDMVHPYLRRRQGLEPVTYPSEAVRDVLARTLGVPIFQEQVIKLAMVAAGFTPGEADQLRRSMAAWKRHGGRSVPEGEAERSLFRRDRHAPGPASSIDRHHAVSAPACGPASRRGLDHFEQRLIEGMRARGYEETFARQIFQQILGFGEYGFPESHAASFALLAYASAWLKCHEPAAFTCALLNSLPMGFYGPSQLVQDAKRHGVEVRPVDAVASDRDCTLEKNKAGEPTLRLGLRMIKGLSQAGAGRLLDARRQTPFRDVEDMARRARLDRRDLEALAASDALRTLGGHRHQARWHVLAVEAGTPLLGDTQIAEAAPLLRTPREGEEIVADYESLSLTLRRHPLALIREQLARRRVITAAEVARTAHGCHVYTAGLVIGRQRPGSASASGPSPQQPAATRAGPVFVTLEDETGQINLVVWNSIMERQRRELLGARLLGVYGEVQREGEVIHVIAKELRDHSALLGRLNTTSRDFR